MKSFDEWYADKNHGYSFEQIVCVPSALLPDVFRTFMNEMKLYTQETIKSELNRYETEEEKM